MSEHISLKYAFLKPFIPISGTEKTYVLFELLGKSLPGASRAPLNLSIALDRSGSMSGAPLKYCKEAGKFVINQLTMEITKQESRFFIARQWKCLKKQLF